MTSVERLVKKGTVRKREFVRKFSENTVAETIWPSGFAYRKYFRTDSTSSVVNTMLCNSDSTFVGRIAGRGAFRSSR